MLPIQMAGCILMHLSFALAEPNPNAMLTFGFLFTYKMAASEVEAFHALFFFE